MTFLLDVLVQWAETQLLPAVLYLQMDNCVRENKKRIYVCSPSTSF